MRLEKEGFIMKVRISTSNYNFMIAESGFYASGFLAVPEICCCRACIISTGGNG